MFNKKGTETYILAKAQRPWMNSPTLRLKEMLPNLPSWYSLM